jgi:DNA-binding NtrC family response regulator
MKTILFVDDEPDVLKILEAILAKAGYAVISRFDAESAVAISGVCRRCLLLAVRHGRKIRPIPCS